MIQKELSQKNDFLPRVKFIRRMRGEKNVYRKNGGRRMLMSIRILYLLGLGIELLKLVDKKIV